MKKKDFAVVSMNTIKAVWDGKDVKCWCVGWKWAQISCHTSRMLLFRSWSTYLWRQFLSQVSDLYCLQPNFEHFRWPSGRSLHWQEGYFTLWSLIFSMHSLFESLKVTFEVFFRSVLLDWLYTSLTRSYLISSFSKSSWNFLLWCISNLHRPCSVSAEWHLTYWWLCMVSSFPFLRVGYSVEKYEIIFR